MRIELYENLIEIASALGMEGTTLLAANICKSESAFICIRHEHRCWCRSDHEIDASESGYITTFTASLMLDSEDPKGLIHGEGEAVSCIHQNLHQISYVRQRGPPLIVTGTPIVLPGAAGVGVLGVLKYGKLALSEEQAATLKLLAGQIGVQLGLALDRKALVDELEASRKSMRAKMDELKAFEDFVENANVPMHMVDQTGRIVWANRKELEFMGYKREEYVGQSISLFHEDQETIAKIMNLLSSGQTLSNIEADLRRKDGSLRRVAISSSVLFDKREFKHTRCVSVDLTETSRNTSALREAELKIARSNELVSSLSRLLTDFIVGDSSTTFEDLLQLFLQYSQSAYGFAAEVKRDAQGNPYIKTYALTDISWSPETREFYEKHKSSGLEFRNLKTLFGQALTTEKVVIANEPGSDPRRGGLPPGHPPLDYFLGIPVKQGGELVGMLGAANRKGGYSMDLVHEMEPLVSAFAAIIRADQHLRAQKEAQKLADELTADLQNQTNELRQANRDLSDFAYIVSHDLKAPLRGIISLSEWLVTDYSQKLGPDGVQSLNLLNNRVRRLNSLVDGILSYSRAGRKSSRSEPVDLAEIIRSTLDLLHVPPHIKVVVEGAMPQVWMDPSRAQQIFQNLVSNAVKYMDKPDGLIVISVRPGNDCWHFSVRDNGPGIEEKYFDRIFGLFQTLAPKDEQESTGVGLAVVKKILEVEGGMICLESKVGEGSTFHFTLPIKNGTPHKEQS
jgi:two-component system, LuxR family, sensor kinase FixL